MSWTAAMEEARASASVSQFELETIEILHPAFVTRDEPDSIRLVLDSRDWDLQLEAAAPLKGGQVVTFQAAAMRITRPPQQEGTTGTVGLSFDFIGREVLPWIDEALSIRADARLIVRTWLANRNATTGEYSVVGPPHEILGGLTVGKINATARTVELTASFRDMLNVGFPRARFTQDNFPGLF